MLVDDNVDAASTLAEVLRMAGHRLEVSNDRHAALDHHLVKPVGEGELREAIVTLPALRSGG